MRSGCQGLAHALRRSARRLSRTRPRAPASKAKLVGSGSAVTGVAAPAAAANDMRTLLGRKNLTLLTGSDTASRSSSKDIARSTSEIPGISTIIAEAKPSKGTV